MKTLLVTLSSFSCSSEAVQEAHCYAEDGSLAAKIATCKLASLALSGILERLYSTTKLSALRDGDQLLSDTLSPLNRRDLTEIKGFMRPPDGVEQCLSCVGACIDGWTSARSFKDVKYLVLGNINEFLPKLSKVRAATFVDSGESFAYFMASTQEPWCDLEYMRRRSAAGGILTAWLLELKRQCLELSKSSEFPRFKHATDHMARIQQDLQHHLENAHVEASVTASNWPGHARQRLLMALSLPGSLEAMKRLEREVWLDTFPDEISVTLSTVTGSETSIEVSPRTTVCQAKTYAADGIQIPALCQQWTCDNRLLQNGVLIADCCPREREKRGRLDVTVLVVTDPMWNCLLTGSVAKQFWEALDVMGQMCVSAFGQAVTAFCMAAYKPHGRHTHPSTHPSAVRTLWPLTEMLLEMVKQDTYNMPTTKKEPVYRALDLDGTVMGNDAVLQLVCVLEEIAVSGCCVATEYLRYCLGYEQDELRQRAMTALSRVGDGQIIPHLLAVIGSTTWNLRHGAPYRQSPEQTLRRLTALAEVLAGFWDASRLAVYNSFLLTEQSTEPYEDSVADVMVRFISESQNDKVFMLALGLAKLLPSKEPGQLLVVLTTRVAQDHYRPALGALEVELQALPSEAGELREIREDAVTTVLVQVVKQSGNDEAFRLAVDLARRLPSTDSRQLLSALIARAGQGYQLALDALEVDLQASDEAELRSLVSAFLDSESERTRLAGLSLLAKFQLPDDVQDRYVLLIQACLDTRDAWQRYQVLSVLQELPPSVVQQVVCEDTANDWPCIRKLAMRLQARAAAQQHE
eukprot:TRINITY_DN57910_c0_g1_i1.p1 TRINITY_DN57910_c0_g1~~TRINITY_DN57910_c0_g1_i1.p1  ORF type:complete len:899 (-),score=80.27 TRINITY_DN57910_c0_g1_i1:9-2423(-)